MDVKLIEASNPFSFILFSIKFSVFSICTFFVLNFHLKLCSTKAYFLTDRFHLSTK